VLDRFGGKTPTWGTGENLLVDRKVVIVGSSGRFVPELL
jgi:hypothetical protein